MNSGSGNILDSTTCAIGGHLTKARKPEIVFIPQGLTEEEIRDRLTSGGLTPSSTLRAGLNVVSRQEAPSTSV